MYNPLRDLKILILDADHALSDVFRDMMRGMGFSNISHTQSGKKALKMMADNTPDFLIMDWNISEMGGTDFIDSIRRNPRITNPTLPIIMLTRKAETSDILLARNKGINEYMVKPFSAQTVYDKLERIVEHPRFYVVADSYVGPDRRSKKAAPPEGKDTRVSQVMPQRRPADPRQIIAGGKPKLWLPDFSLKHKLGHDVALETIITPTVLTQAQATVDAATQESAQWIKDDIEIMFRIHKAMVMGNHSDAITNEMNEMALTVSACAGTFGYLKASEVAYMLYLFCCNRLNFSRRAHLHVIEKHLEVLKLMFNANLHGATIEMTQIIDALKKMADKYR